MVEKHTHEDHEKEESQKASRERRGMRLGPPRHHAYDPLQETFPRYEKPPKEKMIAERKVAGNAAVWYGPMEAHSPTKPAKFLTLRHPPMVPSDRRARVRSKRLILPKREALKPD